MDSLYGNTDTSLGSTDRRGVSLQTCGLKLRLNLCGYDWDQIMHAINQVERTIACITDNMEKNISFSLRNLRFMDSVQLMLTYLNKSAAANQPEDLCITV